MKVCSKCKIEKDLVSFYKTSKNKDGYVNTCKVCYDIRTTAWSKNNPDKLKKYYSKKKLASDFKEKKSKEFKSWYERNKDIRNAKVRQNRKSIESIIKMRVLRANRRAKKKNATPKWLSKEQKKQISDIYFNCPAGHQVDHHIPLQGKDACGLHVPWNLEYLTKFENMSKGNRLPK